VEVAELSLTTPNAQPEPQCGVVSVGRHLVAAGCGELCGGRRCRPSHPTFPSGPDCRRRLRSNQPSCSHSTILYEFDLKRPDLARIARRAENEYVGVPSGIMDQTAALCGCERTGVFLDTRSEELELVPFDPAASGSRS